MGERIDTTTTMEGIEIQTGITRAKDPYTKIKTYKGKIGVVYGDGAIIWRELGKKFDRTRRAFEWADRVKERYVRAIQYADEAWQHAIEERLERIHPEDGDVILVKTTEGRRDAVMKGISQIAEHIDANALFLVVTEDQHIKVADPKLMRECGWIRWPPTWWRRLFRR